MSHAGAPKRSVLDPAELLGLLGVTAMVALQAAKCLPDYDLPWHLALGRVIAESRALPKIDPLAYTARPIGYMEFVSDLAFYGVMRLSGPFGLQLAGAVMAAAIARITEQRAKDAGAVRWLVLGFSLYALNNWLIVRPATLSFIALSLVLWAIEAHRADPGRSRTALWSTVPLVVLWANVHGFVVLGVALLVGYASYRWLCRFAHSGLGALFPARDGEAATEPTAVALAALVASGANLAGYSLLAGPFRARQDFQRIGEWQTTSWSFLIEREPGVLAFGLLVLLSLVVGRERNGQRAPNAFELGLIVLALLLARSALRLLPVAVVITAPIAARRLAPLLPARAPLRALYGVAVLAAAPLSFLNVPTSFGVGFDPRHFPEAAVRFVEQKRPVGHMWNLLDFGGYLAWRMHPAYQVFIDGRSGWVHDPEMLRRFHASLYDEKAFDELVRDQSMEWAITRAREGERLGAPLAASASWTMVHLDPLAAVYVKTVGPNAELARAGYRVLRHLTPPPLVLQAAVDRSISPADLGHDGALALEQAPDSPRAAFLAACGAIALRDAPRFASARARLAKLAPGHPSLNALDAAAVTTSTQR